MSATIELEELADVVRTALAERYAVPVMRVGDGTVQVPAGNAVTLARTTAAAAGCDDVERRIVPIDVATLPWFRVPPGGLRLWRQHGVDEAAGGELVTEVVEGDPHVQVVAAHDGWQLVRLLDGAQGWIEPRDAHHALEQVDEAATPGSVEDVDPDALAAAVEGMLGVPYRWGGTTGAGVDCSGLVQRAAWTVGRCWLPRHSTALLRVGRRVAPSRADRGDVLVLRRDMSTFRTPDDPDAFDPAGGPAVHPMHIAVVVGDGQAVHASRDAWQVVTEPVMSLRERFKVLSARRLGPAD